MRKADPFDSTYLNDIAFGAAFLFQFVIQFTFLI